MTISFTKNILYSFFLFTFIGFEMKPQHKFPKIDPFPLISCLLYIKKCISRYIRERPYCRQINNTCLLSVILSVFCLIYQLQEHANTRDRQGYQLYIQYSYWLYICNGRSIDKTKKTHPSIVYVQWKETQDP